MAYKVKITNVEQNIAKITVTYQVLNDDDQLVVDGQSCEIGDPNNATLSGIKGELLQLAKDMQEADTRAVELQSCIGTVIPVD